MGELYAGIMYFLSLSVETEVLWLVFPLAISTIVMLFYFERYSDERPGWNTYVANSLVLLFVSIFLLRYLYTIDGGGAFNFVDLFSKFVFSIVIFFIGVIVLFFNFRHLFPDRIAKYVSSPLTLNLIAYIGVLFVYSELENARVVFFSLLFLFIVFILLLNFLKAPIKRFFAYLNEMKEIEKKESLSYENAQIKQLKGEIRDLKKGKKKERKIVGITKKYVKEKDKLMGKL